MAGAADRMRAERWPLKLSIALVLSLCAAAWAVVASVLHMLVSAVS